MKPVVDIRSDLGIDFVGRLLSFSYEDNDKKKDKVRITLDNGDLELLDWYPPGSMATVRWGYPGNLTPWRVVQLRKVTGFEELTFEGTSLESVLDRVERTDAYYGGSYSAIVRGIAQNRYGFSGRLLHVEDTAEAFDLVNQVAETDAAFMKRLAVENGFVFYVDDTGLHWHAPKYDAPPIREIVWRRDHPGNVVIGQPRIEFDLLRHFRKVKKKSLDPKNKTTGTEELDPESDTGALELGAKSPDDRLWTPTISVTATGEKPVQYEFDADALIPKIIAGAQKSEDPALMAFAAQVQADPKLAQLVSPTLVQEMAQLSEMLMSHGSAKNKKRALAAVKITLGLTVIGDPSLRAKEVIRVLGIPRILEGNLYVKQATHNISTSGGYEIPLKLRKQNLEKQPKKGKLKDTGAQVNAEDAVKGGKPTTVIYADQPGFVYEYPPGFIGPM